MHQNFQTGHRSATRGGGDAPAGLWALWPGRSRSWSRRSAPGSPHLQTTRSPFVSSYTHTHSLTHAHAHTRNKPVCQPSLRPLSIQVSPWSGGCGCRVQGGSLLITLIPSPRCVFRFLQVNKKRIFIFFFKKSTVFPLYPFKGAFSLLQVIPKRGCASERNEFSPPLAKTHDFSQRTALTPLATIALVSLGMLEKLDIRSR